jgi:hypothetical protein
MRIFRHEQNKIINFVGDANMLTKNVWITGSGSCTFDITDSRFLAILNTDAQYMDIEVAGTDSLSQPFAYSERVYFTYGTTDTLVNNEFAKFQDQIIDFEAFLINASVTITLDSEDSRVGLLLAGYFTEFGTAMQDGFSKQSLNTFLKGRSASKKAYKMSAKINDYQAMERMFTENVGEFFLAAIPSKKHGGFFTEYGRVDLKSVTMRNPSDVYFNLEVQR